MPESLTAADLLPLVKKLSHDEQIQLARMTLLSAAQCASDDAVAYDATPPREDEFGDDADGLGWDGDGWGEFDAPR